MTTLERREKCLRNRSEKGHLRALRAHQMRNRPLPAPLETPWTKTGLDLAERGRPAYTGVGIGESKRKSRLILLLTAAPSQPLEGLGNRHKHKGRFAMP